MTALAKLLRHKKIECDLIDGDSSFDHCVMRLTGVRHPDVDAFLEYENRGSGTRLAGLLYKNDERPPSDEDYPLEWQEILKLEGARIGDPDKIAEWVGQVFFTHDT